MKSFVHCPGEPIENFGTLLKYTIKPEIDDFQMVISRASINIFGPSKKLLDPCVMGFHINLSNFL